jgi:anaerobic magnesium-protoporphyrin IX monomethyl ester cyclase
MKILFINPSLRPGFEKKIFPLGLACVLTYVKENGYDFDLMDIDINGYDDDYVENFIKENKYDVILYGTIVTHYKWIKWLTRTIKKHQPSTTVVVGNSVAASCLEVFMANAPADIAIKGEGEVTCLEVLNALRDGGELKDVSGIAFRNLEGELVKNPNRPACDINELPKVDWDLFDVPNYLNRYQWTAFGVSKHTKSIVFPLSTARGCTFRCTFCHFVYWEDPFRYRSPEKIVEEIRHNIEKYGTNYLNFNDDLTLSSLVQAERLADAILASGLKFDWSASVRTDLLGKPNFSYKRRLGVAKKLKESGCKTLSFSLEHANDEILALMEKHVKKEYFSEQINILREVGIMASCSVVFGYPPETGETIKETFDFCLQNRVYPSIGFLMPLPYTKMYEYAVKNGFIKDEDAYLDSITERQDICLNMTKLSDEEIMGHIKENAFKLNQMLEIGLDESTLIRTGGPRQHINTKAQLNTDEALDPEEIERSKNDFSFNYSQATFDEDMKN